MYEELVSTGVTVTGNTVTDMALQIGHQHDAGRGPVEGKDSCDVDLFVDWWLYTWKGGQATRMTDQVTTVAHWISASQSMHTGICRHNQSDEGAQYHSGTSKSGLLHGHRRQTHAVGASLSEIRGEAAAWVDAAR